MTLPVALDTSVAVPLVVERHAAHSAVTRWWAGRSVALAGHAAAETYSVLTRLPGDLRLMPDDAARLLRARFSAPLVLEAEMTAELPGILAGMGIAGGATYDGMVALAARSSGAALATRDARALGTYRAVGVEIEIVG